MKRKILVTGCAGFIGMHTCLKFLLKGYDVVGIDNLNKYYSQKLKLDRLKNIKKFKKFKFYKKDICDFKKLSRVIEKENVEYIIHLAAQAGVRYSITNPKKYIDYNLNGFFNILEVCKKFSIKHLVFASSSSVYGSNSKLPFNENDKTETPLSLYAATKKSNELLAHSYSNIFSLPVTGLRFFTVYGPWGRPDMSLFIFTEAIIKNKELPVYNFGNMKRDFTYVDDVTNAIIKLVFMPPKPTKKNKIKYQIFNIGNNNPILLKNYIKLISKELNKKPKIKNLPLQSGDVKATFSDSKKLYKYTNIKAKVKINSGIKEFISWYKKYFKIR